MCALSTTDAKKTVGKSVRIAKNNSGSVVLAELPAILWCIIYNTAHGAMRSACWLMRWKLVNVVVELNWFSSQTQTSGADLGLKRLWTPDLKKSTLLDLKWFTHMVVKTRATRSVFVSSLQWTTWKSSLNTFWTSATFGTRLAFSEWILSECMFVPRWFGVVVWMIILSLCRKPNLDGRLAISDRRWDISSWMSMACTCTSYSVRSFVTRSAGFWQTTLICHITSSVFVA